MRIYSLIPAAIAFQTESKGEYQLSPKVRLAELKAPAHLESLNANDLPAEFSWKSKGMLTPMRNQHIPQYCGSCWAHGAVSALQDRIKIARTAKGVNAPDIELSIQNILNCAAEEAGSCHGGSHFGAYQWIQENGIPFETGMPYLACSAESQEGFCPKIASELTCDPINKARTCGTFGVDCVGLTQYPNATISATGQISGADNLKAEIMKNGPVACGVNANPLRDYKGGIFDDSTQSTMIDHIISIVGWGSYTDKDGKAAQYWEVRNSWGEYWGELGFFRAKLGENLLGLEDSCAWATPKEWTEVNFPCGESGDGCGGKPPVGPGEVVV